MTKQKYIVIILLLLNSLMLGYGTPFPASSGMLLVEVVNLRNNQGKVRAAIFRSKEGFPMQRTKAFKTVEANIQNGKALLKLTELPHGEYAIVLMHDENNNKEMDSNWAGLPKEGYGASNDAKATIRPPRYEDAKFILKSDKLAIQIKVKYL